MREGRRKGTKDGREGQMDGWKEDGAEGSRKGMEGRERRTEVGKSRQEDRRRKGVNGKEKGMEEGREGRIDGQKDRRRVDRTIDQKEGAGQTEGKR